MKTRSFKYILENYNLSIVLVILFLVSWVLQTYFGWYEFKAEQQEHGQAAQWFGDSGYVWAWSRATFENWQSEFLQLFSFVTLTGFLIHKGSPESRDGEDAMGAQLTRIENMLKAMKK
jgi:hypothetical protein